MDRSDLLALGALLAFAALLFTVWEVDRRRRRRSGVKRTMVSGMVGTFDEVFHPEAARASEIREVQQELPAAAPVPGDPLAPGGRIVIEPPPRREPDQPAR